MRPADLRGILKYIPEYREKTFIIAVDGAIVTQEDFGRIVLDVALLWSLSIRVVLVHGASAQIEALARSQGLTASDLDGAGITDEPTLQLALTAANRLTHEILEGLTASDLRAAYANAVIAHPMGILQGVDQLFTGRVERVDVELLRALMSHGIIPVVPPLGFDGTGRTYRVNSDSVAVEMAKALGAIKLIFITTTDGLTIDGQLIRQVLAGELAELLAKDAVAAELVSKAHHAVVACNAGVQRVHIISGLVDEGLLAEVFSNEGIGTLVFANEYQQIRRAVKRDVRTIQLLIRGSVETEELAKRSRASIERQIDDYYLFEIDRNPVACVALHTYPEQGVGELGCLYVRPSHENQGLGSKMVQFVESRAREMGLHTLIALSTQAFTFFTARGFSEGIPDDLPQSRREKYDQNGRNSKVLVKRIALPA